MTTRVTRPLLLLLALTLLSMNVQSESIHDTFHIDFEGRLALLHMEIDRSLQLRKNAMDFYRSEKAEGSGQYFDARDTRLIQQTVADYIDNRQAILNNFSEFYRPLIERTELSLVTSSPTTLHTDEDPESGIVSYRLQINPNDEKGRHYISAFKMGLAATLTLYDNYIIAIMPYQQHGTFRRLINLDNREHRRVLDDISANFRRLDNYRDTLRVVEFNDTLDAWLADHTVHPLHKDGDIAYLNLLIEGSFTNRHIKEVHITDRLSFRARRFRRILQDFVIDSGNETIGFISQIFGNSMGMVVTREGLLKDIPDSHKEVIHASLEPGDILLEKTPFRLTDQFIPGHWGHVAIWVGTEEDLKRLGVWDELPALHARAQRLFGYRGLSFQQQIREGNHIVEALRPGVQINSLEEFLNIDDLAVLRYKQSENSSLKRYILRTFKQVGKAYDFNFDVETDTRIVCSELAFVAYDDLDWPVDRAAGRYTISPDHIAEKATEDGPFSVVMLYHDGKRVARNLSSNFERLVATDYTRIKQDLVPISR